MHDKCINCRFQFHEKFYREKFLPYKFRPHADLEEIARMAQQLDPDTDILSRFNIDEGNNVNLRYPIFYHFCCV